MENYFRMDDIPAFLSGGDIMERSIGWLLSVSICKRNNPRVWQSVIELWSSGDRFSAIFYYPDRSRKNFQQAFYGGFLKRNPQYCNHKKAILRTITDHPTVF